MTEFDKNKCGYSNYEGMKNMDEKEEFRVDKVGWYRTKNGLIRELIAILDDKNNTCIFKVPTGFGLLFTDLKGNILPIECPINDRKFYKEFSENICEYLGKELPKEPRKFEFEAIYTTYEGFLGIDEKLNQALIGKKWHVTMKEIIE